MIERVHITADYDWHAARRQFVGASQVATVCGIRGAFRSLAELYAEKKGIIAAQDDNVAMQRGRWLEPGAFQALADTEPEWKVIRARVHVIDRDRRIAATPDGYAQAPDRPGIGIVEAKVVAHRTFRQWLADPEDFEGPATIPEYYRAQVITQMMLEPECPWAVLAVLIVSEYGASFRLFDVEFDAELADLIKQKVKEFYELYFDPGIMPPYDPLRDGELVRRLHPKDDGSEIDLTGDNRAMIATDDWLKAAAELKDLQAVETALKTELIGKLGDHTFARLADGRRLSCKTTKRNGYVVQPTQFRTLRLLENRRP